MHSQRILKAFLIMIALSFVFVQLPFQNVVAKETIRLRLAHMYPDKNPVGMAAIKFTQIVAEKSSGRVQIDIFPAGQLGNEVKNREALMSGTLDMCLNSVPTFSAYVPEVAMTDLPYFWRGPEHYLKFWEGDLGEKFISQYEKATGIKVISVNWLTSMRHVAAKKPIRIPSDLKGVKIRVTQGFQHHYDGFYAMGATPVFMAFPEVYSALQQGVLDAMENPVPDIYRSKFHEVCKYISLTGHIFNSRAVQINNKKWNKISPDLQEIITAAADEAGLYHQMLNGLLPSEGEEGPVEFAMKKMKSAGVTFIKPDKEKFAELVRQNAHPKYIKKYKNGQSLYDEIQALGR